jgi:hypothetical protein
MSDKLAELEAQAAALGAEIAKLKAAQPTPAPRPPRLRDEEGVRVVELLTERIDGMPNLREMEKLFVAVKHLAPWPLSDRYDEQRPLRGFGSCFRWLANKDRTDYPNPKFALSFWLDSCKSWLRDRGSMVNDVDAPTLILAAYAQGDLRYVPANGQLGTVWELGLAEYSGKPASPEGWRRILREGASAILPPSAPAHRLPAQSQVRIVGGW